jgi:hypothetical protein
VGFAVVCATTFATKATRCYSTQRAASAGTWQRTIGLRTDMAAPG